MHALEKTAKGHNESLFPLVMDSLRYLINDGAYDQCPQVTCSSFTDVMRNKVIAQLCARSDDTQTRLSVALDKGNGALLVVYFAALHLRRT